MGDGTFINGANPVYTYATADTYTVRLTYFSGDECPVIAEKEINVQDDKLNIPNVFTPTLVDDNMFEMPGIETGIWNLEVYNRWGIRVYTMNDYDGKWTGEEVPAGVYYYKLINAFRSEKSFKGDVHIIK